MLTNRQKEILKLIVEEYISTAKEIGSGLICQRINCSSATIRNEMAVLEKLDLIEKTHISSGRIPSEKGYRYYVDNLMQPKELSGEDMLKLQTIFYNNSLALGDVVTRSMEIVSDLTNYTAVVLGSSSSDNLIAKIEVVPTSEQRLIALLITDKGHVEHKSIYLAEDISLTEIKKTVEIINRLIIGTPVDEVSEILEYKIKPVIEKHIKQHEILYNAFYDAFKDVAAHHEVKIKGTSKFLSQPEFDDSNKIREILTKFDDPALINCIKHDEDGVKVYIGSESEFDDDIGIIKSSYEINGQKGTVAIIGPKRMEYDRVLSLLKYINENIGGGSDE